MAKTLLELSMSDIIPPSIAEDPQIKSMMTSLDPELQSVSHDIGEALIVSRIDELPEPVVDLLAWQWHVDFYELARTLEMKRAAVKGSIAWHRKKGTVWAIEKALEMLGIKGTVIEWWKIPGAVPYTFAVEAVVSDEFWSMFPGAKDAAAAVRHAVIASKSTRSGILYLTTTIREDAHMQHHHGIATIRGGSLKIGPARPTPEQMRHSAGIATVHGGKLVINPERPGIFDHALFYGIATVHRITLTINPAPERKEI